jgi:hypothetical protein
MLKLAFDENFDQDIVRGVLRRNSQLDIVTVQQAGLSGADDPAVLAWAASEGRVLFTHDVRTMTRHAYDRAGSGQSMPGVFEVSTSLSMKTAIDDILIIAEYSLDGEWEGQVRYLPL